MRNGIEKQMTEEDITNKLITPAMIQKRKRADYLPILSLMEIRKE